ncbi:MAG: aminotransferase class V-fold PLP-dependent enzyme [Deltaproteobacteria bacterium]|nr:aminotransferase class V-fold PLP-dependent enzyme [Deltaproteobacteria bacterium]
MMDVKKDHQIFDVEFARKQFPYFELENSAEWAFFDNAGGTFPCRCVMDKLAYVFLFNKVQPFGDNALAAAAGDQMDKGRQVIKDLLGVSMDTITIGPSTTQNLNTLSNACTGFLKPEDEIIVSEQDHEANIGGWERAARQTGATLRLWKVNEQNGELALADLEAILTRKTKILCVTHSSNIIGTVNPIEKIIDMGHKYGAKVVIDGVSYAPHRWPDLSDTKSDVYCFSTYKTYATHQGIMYISPQFLEMLTPQCHFFNAHRPWSRMDTAGPDHAGIAALAGLGDYFGMLHDHHFGSSDQALHIKAAKISDLMNRHEESLCSLLLDRISQLPLRILGKTQMTGREANIALVSVNHTSAELSARIGKKGIATKYGHFYAYRVLKKMGFDPDDGVLRLSFAHYNNMAETLKLADALADISE